MYEFCTRALTPASSFTKEKAMQIHRRERLAMVGCRLFSKGWQAFGASDAEQPIDISESALPPSSLSPLVPVKPGAPLVAQGLPRNYTQRLSEAFDGRPGHGGAPNALRTEVSDFGSIPRTLIPAPRFVRSFVDAENRDFSQGRGGDGGDLTSSPERKGQEEDEEAGDISILGRVGQNAEINGEYEILPDEGGEAGGRPLGRQHRSRRPAYRKRSPLASSPSLSSVATPQPGGGGERRRAAGPELSAPLFLFHMDASDSETPAFWAIGELLGENAKIRAFVLSSAETPDKAQGEWMVFETAVYSADPPLHPQPAALPPAFRPDPYVVAVRVSCSNGALDGAETGLDCGGPKCAPCSEFRSCRLPKQFPAGGYALGDCPTDGRLIHGQACTYKCPLGWREGGALGRICYDGTVLEIRRGRGCERAFELPENDVRACQFLLLEGAPEAQSSCNGLFISHIVTGMSGQRAIFWQKDLNGKLIQLYWEEGYWICGSFETDEEFGYLPDMTPQKLIQARSVPLASDDAVWSTPLGPQQTSPSPASLHCVDPLKPFQQSPRDANRCPAFLFAGWSRSDLNGYWYELFPSSSDGRPRFINEQSLVLHWTPLGYWVVGVSEDETLATALAFSPSKYPPPNGWRLWNAQKGLWEAETRVRADCVPEDDRGSTSSDFNRWPGGVSGSEENFKNARNRLFGFPAPLLDISASSHILGLPPSPSREPYGQDHSRTRAGLLQGLIAPEEGDARLGQNGDKLEALDIPKPHACPHLLLEGGVGLGERCNGVWTRPSARLHARRKKETRGVRESATARETAGEAGGGEDEDDQVSGKPNYLFKLSIDSRVLYLYNAEGQWRCTADGTTMLGFSNKGVALREGIEQQERVNGDRLIDGRTGDFPDDAEEGNWLDGMRYVSAPWKLSCFPQEKGLENKCDEVSISGFAESAEPFNGLWVRRVDSPSPSQQPRFVKQVVDSTQGGPYFPALDTELHLYRHPVGLWVIGQDTKPKPKP
ncbi:hypothetical protein BESB_070760 [Besnoitia besnoiti]|uniref:Uncharacterized protein n=1 Tax=Besnoitia besnoiti TaxID=94643 RepID=A0A2A9M9P3_BESBE|nr:uncharacterized protein BESB_070760 [Besnoitia besnoiti]PFH33924.1 hypothetical protein BESB_070760 [Besnoitia besnoiti]